MKKVLCLLLVVAALSACGPASRVNSNKTSVSTWEARHKGLQGGPEARAEIELTTFGSFFYYTKKLEGEKGVITESTAVYDGTHLTEFGFKTYHPSNPSKVREFKHVVQLTPDPDFLKEKLFWKIPSSLPLAEDGTEEIGGVQTTRYISRQHSALGGEAVYRFWVDAGRGALMKRQDSIGEDSGGSGDSVLGTTFTCTRLELKPNVPPLPEVPQDEAQKILLWKWIGFNDGAAF